ncbi:kinase-like protein [Sarocladium strictum]
MSLISSQDAGSAQYVACTKLARGASATIFLVHERRRDQLLAVKCRQRSELSEPEEELNTRRENELFLLLSKTNSPFFPRLWDILKTTNATYLIMDFFGNGDLEALLQRQPFTPSQTRFYAAELCLAVEYIHDNGILHRNIQLDNILLASDGHIKLSGFGVYKAEMKSPSKTSTFCGSVSNLPPEILLDQPYGMAVDWWYYGVTLYQMIAREDPFQGDTTDDLYDAILSDCELHYPADLPRSHRDILCGLLQRDPNQRLGGTGHDSIEVKRHEYFQGVDWENVPENFEVPFVPTRKNSHSGKCLCPQTADNAIDSHNYTSKELPAEIQSLFADFSQSLAF